MDYTSKANAEISFLECLRKSTNRYLLPYYLYSGFVIAIKIICVDAYDRSFGTILFDVLSGQGGDHILWFFFAMFWITIIAYIINRICKQQIGKLLIAIIIYIACFMLRGLNVYNLFKVLSAGIGLLFYMFGNVLEVKKLEQYFTIRNGVLLACINILGSVFVIRNGGFILDVNTARVYAPLFTAIISITGVLFSCYISMLLESGMKKYYISNYTNNIIKHIGKNTIFFFPITAIIPAIALNISNIL